MQWHALLGISDPEQLGGSYELDSPNGSNWMGQDPATGEMNLNELDSLCEILASYTAEPGCCYFGLCTIQGWRDFFSPDDLKPLLKLSKGREYVVLTGPLSAVGQITRDSPNQESSRQTTFSAWQDDEPPPKAQCEQVLRDVPNLIWPRDHSWFLISEVDFDSTLVGGDAKLIKTILESPQLEVWPVDEADSLAADGDKINVSGQDR
jgi:hypothetical protein